MNSFIKISKNFDIDQDFWDLNPQLKIIPPFSELYTVKDSSKIMWAIFFMCDPDEEENLLFRIPPEERKKVIEEEYIKVDWEDEIVSKCMKEYSWVCLTSIQRALKEEKDSLVARSKLFRDTEPTLDKTTIIDGKPFNIKGTALQLDAMRAKTLKIYEEFEKVEAKFKKAKAEDARVYGGRKETLSEQGKI